MKPPAPAEVLTGVLLSLPGGPRLVRGWRGGWRDGRQVGFLKAGDGWDRKAFAPPGPSSTRTPVAGLWHHLLGAASPMAVVPHLHNRPFKTACLAPPGLLLGSVWLPQILPRALAARCDCEARPGCGDWLNGVNEASIPGGCLCQDASSYVSLSPAGGALNPLPGQEADWALREAGAWSGSHRTRGQSCNLSPALCLRGSLSDHPSLTPGVAKRPLSHRPGTWDSCEPLHFSFLRLLYLLRVLFRQQPLGQTLTSQEGRKASWRRCSF